MNQKNTEKPITQMRLNILGIGCFLLAAFLISVTGCVIWLISEIAHNGFLDTMKEQWLFLCIIILVEITVFWIGIIMVYATSLQLGIKLRIIGIICGWMPIIHILVLLLIIRTTFCETVF